MKKVTGVGLLSAAALAAVLGLTSRADAAPITPEEPFDREPSELIISPYAGFGVRFLGKSDALERQVDGDARDVYEPAMPGFASWLQLSGMMPYISLGVDVNPFEHLTDKGAQVEFGTEFNFSSSGIFGEHNISKTFDASVMEGKFVLGPTPTTFTQHLDFYGNWALRAKYLFCDAGSPSVHGGPFFELAVGVSYIASTSTLHIHVDGTEKANQLVELAGGWGSETLKKLELYRDIRTVAETTGVGISVTPRIGGRITFGDHFGIDLSVGYVHECLWLTMDKRTVKDGDSTEETVHVDSKTGNLDLQVNLRGYF